MYSIARKDKEIDRVIEEASESIYAGTSRWSGMTYEEGVRAAIEWIIGDSNENPMKD